MGVLSLIFWTLILLVTVQYTWLAMSLGKRGEGGTIVLREILVPLLKSGKQVAFVSLLSFIGISLLVGDGVITPAISILSAVEGMLLIPGMEHTQTRNTDSNRSSYRHSSFLFPEEGDGQGVRRFRPHCSCLVSVPGRLGHCFDQYRSPVFSRP